MVIRSVYISVASAIASYFIGRAGKDITRGEPVALHSEIGELKAFLAWVLDRRPNTAAVAGPRGDAERMV